MSYTPGPWRFDDPAYAHERGQYYSYHTIDAGGGIGPTDGFHIAAFISPEDAHLIAAAPDLIDAAKAAVNAGDNEYVKRILLAAIVKAEGGK